MDVTDLINGYTIRPFNDPHMQSLVAQAASTGYSPLEIRTHILKMCPLSQCTMVVNMLSLDILPKTKETSHSLLPLMVAVQRAAFMKKGVIAFNGNAIAFLDWYTDIMHSQDNRVKASRDNVSWLESQFFVSKKEVAAA